jgi:RNA polymerase sigma-70 factor (ECF subfamily)
MAETTLDLAQIAMAVDELPPKLRAVVVLRDVYGLPHEAIAEELGITEAAAKVRLHRARKKLRDQLFPGRGDEEHAHAV